MIDFAQMTFKALAVHKVGNKVRQEGVLQAESLYHLSDDDLKNILLDYFLKPFKKEEFFKFTHDTDLSFNETYNFCKNIFDNKQTLLEQSGAMAKHLYNQATHPKIQSGEFYVTYFADCILDDEVIDAIGIFKSENKDVYLKPEEATNNLLLNYEQGINIKKLDKGCLVFDTFANEGYRVLIVDRFSKNDEARYWKTDFLCLARVHDYNFNTENYLHMCKEFCEDVYAENASRKDQVLFLNKSLNYFTENDSFDPQIFAEEVLEAPEQVTLFEQFKENYEENMGYVSNEDFKISQAAVKTMKRKFKTLIKLDTEIDIKLNSENTEQYIERGYDEQRDMYFYKVFFREEV